MSQHNSRNTVRPNYTIALGPSAPIIKKYFNEHNASINLKYTGLLKQQKTTKNCKQTWNNLKSGRSGPKLKGILDISVLGTGQFGTWSWMRQYSVLINCQYFCTSSSLIYDPKVDRYVFLIIPV